MNQFEKQLEKWNNGVLRGAQAKLARILKVSTATVALWTTGKRNPSKGYIEQMAGLFQIAPQTLRKLLQMPAAPIAYPEAAITQSHTLRENADEGLYLPRPALSAQSNSIAIPLLGVIPSGNTLYEDGDVLEWWTLPRQRTQGAKFLFKLPGTRQIAAIKPGERAAFTQCVVLLKNGAYALANVSANGELQPWPNAANEPLTEVEKVIGSAVFVITENQPADNY